MAAKDAPLTSVAFDLAGPLPHTLTRRKYHKLKEGFYLPVRATGSRSPASPGVSFSSCGRWLAICGRSTVTVTSEELSEAVGVIKMTAVTASFALGCCCSSSASSRCYLLLSSATGKSEVWCVASSCEKTSVTRVACVAVDSPDLTAEAVLWMRRTEAEAPESPPRLLLVMEHSLAMAVCNLDDQTLDYLPAPKMAHNSVAFDETCDRFCVLHRHKGSDLVAVYDAVTLERLETFAVESEDAREVLWVKGTICVVDTPQRHCMALYSPEGERKELLLPFDDKLGIQEVALAQKGGLAAVAGYDMCLRIVHLPSGRIVRVLAHGRTVPEHVIAYRDVPNGLFSRKYVVLEHPVELGEVEEQWNAAGTSTSLGVGLVEWSSCGTFLASRADTIPNVLFIWNVLVGELEAVLVHQRSILDAKWEPQRKRLCIATGSYHMFFWTPKGASCLDLPDEDARVQEILYGSKGSAAFLSSSSFFLCYSDAGEDEDNVAVKKE